MTNPESGYIVNYNHEPIATYKISYKPTTLKITFELFLKTNNESVYLHNKLANTNISLFGNILCFEIGQALPVNEKTIVRYVKVQEQSPSISSIEGIYEDLINEASTILRRQWHKGD